MKFYLVVLIASLLVFANALTKKEIGECVTALDALSSDCKADDNSTCVATYAAWTEETEPTEAELTAAAKCFTDLADSNDCKADADAAIISAGEECTKESGDDDDDGENSTILSVGLLLVLAVLAF